MTWTNRMRMPLVSVAPAILLVASLTGAGCTCRPLLEVDACYEDRRDCDPDWIQVWAEADAARYPQLDALLAGMAYGEHAHPTLEPEYQEFWETQGSPTRLHVERGDTLYRLRVVSCG